MGSGEAVCRHSIGTRGGSNTDGVSLHINPVVHYFHTVCSEVHLLVYVYLDNFEIAIIVIIIVKCLLHSCRNCNFKLGYVVWYIRKS